MRTLYYDSEGKIEAHDSVIATPDRLQGAPFITVTDDVWHEANSEPRDNRVVNNALISTPIMPITPTPALGQLTVAYINKLNVDYPALGLLGTDSIEDAKVKMIRAGVSFEQAGTLVTFYDKGW